MHSLATITALAGALSLLAGCPNGNDECFFGDRDLAPEIEMIYRTIDGRTETVVSGTELPLIQPPQGGKIVLVGVRARNLDICGPQLSASLRDQCTQRILALEERPLVLKDDGTGWAVPERPTELQNYANLPTCPTAAAVRDVEEEPYLVRVRITDRGGRTASAETMVTPVCAEPGNEQLCKCECGAGYILGAPCTPEIDGGPPPGTCDVSDAGVADAAAPDAGVPDASEADAS